MQLTLNILFLKADAYNALVALLKVVHYLRYLPGTFLLSADCSDDVRVGCYS